MFCVKRRGKVGGDGGRWELGKKTLKSEDRGFKEMGTCQDEDGNLLRLRWLEIGTC